ncbi:MAG: helix-hairpin-helix domain-containing protein [Devosia sp.]
MIGRRTLVLLGLALPLLGPATVFAQSGRLNPNTASSKQLAGVSGLPADLAKAIVAQRPFATMVEFNALVRAALKEGAAEALYEHLFIPINLNSAARAEIALIPGMSGRMVREFLEYRPYADIEVFNREIGKYVDDAEVARLRSYVTL